MTNALGPPSPAIRQFIQTLMPGRPALAFLTRAAAEVWGVSEAELTGPSRAFYLLEARQAVSFLGLRMAAHGPSKVGRHLCRHHATPYHAAKRMEERIESDPVVKARVASCWSIACLLANRHGDKPEREMSYREVRAYNEGVEAAAKIAELWADECIRMADHTIKADPLLEMVRTGGKRTPAEVERAYLKSAALTDEGNEHALRHHTAKHIAAMIRQQKVRRVR